MRKKYADNSRGFCAELLTQMDDSSAINVNDILSSFKAKFVTLPNEPCIYTAYFVIRKSTRAFKYAGRTKQVLSKRRSLHNKDLTKIWAEIDDETRALLEKDEDDLHFFSVAEELSFHQAKALEYLLITLFRKFPSIGSFSISCTNVIFRLGRALEQDCPLPLLARWAFSR
jgi:hypothetical protein